MQKTESMGFGRGLILCLCLCLLLTQAGAPGWTVAHALVKHRRHKKLIKLTERVPSLLVPSRTSAAENSIHFLLYPSDVAGAKRKIRIKTILETWGTDIRDMMKQKAIVMKITLMLTEEEEQEYQDLKPAFDLFELAVVPKRLIKKPLVDGIYLG